jgi:hypothetical protein
MEPHVDNALAGQLILIGVVSAVTLGVYGLIAFFSGNAECRYVTADLANRIVRRP